MIDLKDVATCDLVAELKRREGVEVHNAYPHTYFGAMVEGPAVVLVVTD